jgi:cyanophycinase
MGRDRNARRGTVIAIGGAEDKIRSRRILGRVLELAGADEARIAIIPTASRLPSTGDRYRQLFSELGAKCVRVLPFKTRADCSDSGLLDALSNATGVFMTGGNQLRLATTIGGTPAARMLRRRNREEALVVAGTSAGAAIMSEHMIVYGKEGSTPRAGMVSISPGLGLVNTVIIDQHFRQRDRLGRLLTALAYNPFAIGVGLDEDTAVMVRDAYIDVIGQNAVTIVDPSGLSHSALGTVREGEPVSLIGLRLHVLVDGGFFDIARREAHAAAETVSEVSRRDLAAADRDVKGVSSDDDDDTMYSTQDFDAIEENNP